MMEAAAEQEERYRLSVAYLRKMVSAYYRMPVITNEMQGTAMHAREFLQQLDPEWHV